MKLLNMICLKFNQKIKKKPQRNLNFAVLSFLNVFQSHFPALIAGQNEQGSTITGKFLAKGNGNIILRHGMIITDTIWSL